ncbi:MAG: alpha/beta hydrolase [Tannerellaceae bacterium]|jgi:pimeloyl-ACP methyl ester carboxylesterase|nr:alpha/beta hydrolase [Tannerellaceae bacterium]
MKKATFILLILLAPLAVAAQDIAGTWLGTLTIPNTSLRIVFNIISTDTTLSATMDSPDQNAKGIPVTTITFENLTLKLTVAPLGIEYQGTMNADGNISGTFKQSGLAIPLTLSKTTPTPISNTFSRPQEPRRPLPYKEEEVTIHNNKANLSLAGTLTLPAREGPHPALILISGSGAQNRDEEIYEHKPFMIIADHLTRNGIAVLRYDDRGTAGSTGNFSNATTLDLSSDAEAALNYLQTRSDIVSEKIGILGHSEGAIIAPMIAARNTNVVHLILLAPPAIPGNQLLLCQYEAISRASGTDDELIQWNLTESRKAFDIILQPISVKTMRKQVSKHIKQNMKHNPFASLVSKEARNLLIQYELDRLLNPWTIYFLRYDPAPVLSKVQCPILAIIGNKDLQVPSDANTPALYQAIKNNPEATIKELPNLNHLLQECQTGLPSEYASIQQTISPNVLNEITNWIKNN